LIKKFSLFILAVLLLANLSIAGEEAAEKVKKVEANPIVEIQTNHGSIFLEVFLNETPIHATNFLNKVDAGSYDSLTFHRVVSDFVNQGGDPTGTGAGSMGPDRLGDEVSPFPQARGTVAMARSAAGASNCQFYINMRDNSFLDKQKFSSFAKVVKGMDVVDAINKVPTTNDKPNEPVVMTKLQRVESIPE